MIESLILRGKMGCPEEIAPVALFLASDESSYVNGGSWLSTAASSTAGNGRLNASNWATDNVHALCPACYGHYPGLVLILRQVSGGPAAMSLSETDEEPVCCFHLRHSGETKLDLFFESPRRPISTELARVSSTRLLNFESANCLRFAGAMSISRTWN